MTKCIDCKRKFPMELISPTFAGGEYHNLCAICALKFIRKNHGLKDYMFTGVVAKQLYEDTLNYLKGKKNE